MGYSLVRQGIEIFRTEDRAEAVRIMNEANKKCMDNGEPYADNEVFLYEDIIIEE